MMIQRRDSIIATTLTFCLMLGACGKGDVAQPTDEAVADVQSLNPAAREAAIDMITGDLNVPLQDLQRLLAEAVDDGRIGSDELWMQGARGAIPVDWWLWNKGYLNLVDDPTYGAHFTLSEKGQRFVSSEPPLWLIASAEGAPQMDCRAAGSLTSAACTAVFAYQTIANPGADLAQVSFPAANANLEAAFAPGEGWSVSNLAVDGDAPRDTARYVIFGDPASVAEPRERFVEALRARLEAGRTPPTASETPSPAAPVPAVQPSKSDGAAAAPNPSEVINLRTLRAPSHDELMGVYPSRALTAGIAGRASISCIATVSGTLRDCEATSEAPPGYRFGQAAVTASRHYRLSPRTVDGVAVESRVNLTLDWQ